MIWGQPAELALAPSPRVSARGRAPRGDGAFNSRFTMSMARRFSLPAVTEASYEPRQIPNAARDMAGTVILRPERQQWLSLLGEMVQAGSSSLLLCTYARALYAP